MKAFTLITALLALLALYGFNTMNSSDNTYAKRLGKIAQHINSINTTWKAENPERFLNQNIAAIKQMMGTNLNENILEAKEYSPEELKRSPKSFDSRVEWPNCQSIKEVRDQGDCGSCWAFGTAEAMSDRICITSNQKLQTRVSTQDIAFCCHNCGNGCEGGNPSAAWRYFVDQGVVTGDLYGDEEWCQSYSLPPCAHHTTSQKYKPCAKKMAPTPQCKKSCNPKYPKSWNSDLQRGKKAYVLAGEIQFKREISSHGPISVGFTVYEDFLTYKSGVYKHETGQELGGHEVKIIGYGDDAGVKYWLIANSWNETWGADGFFKMIRGRDNCGIESNGSAGTIKV